MGLCFAVGIGSSNPLIRRASGIYVVEYIGYSIRGDDTDSIEIVGDLFLPNPDKEDRRFSIIHPGDIHFEVLRAEKILAKEEFHTVFLEKLYSPALNCKFDRNTGRLLGLGPPDLGPVEIYKADSYSGSLSRQNRDEEGNAPFTLLDIQVPGKVFGFIRLRTFIKGETLNRLSKNKTYFDVYGGEILLNRIKSLDIPAWKNSRTAHIDAIRTIDYESTLQEFIGNAYVEPERYDVVLWSSQGSRPIKARRLSRDLFMGCEEYLLQGRKIDWYWSRSAHFYACSYPNGLHVGIDFTESRTKGKKISCLKGL